MTSSPKNQLHVPGASGAVRDRGRAVRWARRRDQHHAPGSCRLRAPRSCTSGTTTRSTGSSTRCLRAQGVAVSSYQGSHVRCFGAWRSCWPSRPPGTSGSTAVAAGSSSRTITRLSEAGVRIFSPEDGQQFGLPGMINQLHPRLRHRPRGRPHPGGGRAGGRTARTGPGDHLPAGRAPAGSGPRGADGGRGVRRVPVLGITGTGGSGKSSLTDELVRRFRTDQQDKLRVAVLAVDPTHRRSGGALLGDRIRMNALDGDHLFFRSLATHGARELPDGIEAIVGACRADGYDLVILETPGMGQGDAAVVPLANVSLYVMTPEFGAASQLEKIDMLDFADVVAINKFERRSSAGAPRRVPPADPRPGHRSARGRRRCPPSGPAPPPSTTTASPRFTSTWPGCWPAMACTSPRVCCQPRWAGRPRVRRSSDVADRVPHRDRRDRPGLPRGDHPAGA